MYTRAMTKTVTPQQMKNLEEHNRMFKKRHGKSYPPFFEVDDSGDELKMVGSAKSAFYFSQTLGFPFEMWQEEFNRKFGKNNIENNQELYYEHATQAWYEYLVGE